METLSEPTLIVFGCSVHLHARGDTSELAGLDSFQPGSPPRAWRHLKFLHYRIIEFRFTSTRVETLTPKVVGVRNWAVHLHARGDTPFHQGRCAAPCGSPPRAWRHYGRDSSLCARGAVHLHARGDTPSIRRRRRSSVGSPPRAWRHFYSGRTHNFCDRFTSTRVETLLSRGRNSPPPTVHLHARGDTPSIRNGRLLSGGSPPRAWRHYCSNSRIASAPRFTSTRVETLMCRRIRGSCRTVHLHARGDTAVKPAIEGRAFGSPPRAWRHCQNNGADAHGRRFTSTRVETLLRVISTGGSVPVHLHARGDTVRPATPDTRSPGSPPRAWRHSSEKRWRSSRIRFTSTRVETLDY